MGYREQSLTMLNRCGMLEFSYLHLKPPTIKDFTEEQTECHTHQHIFHDSIGATTAEEQGTQPNHPVETVLQ